MNYGPVVFLVAFLALAASWFGFVLKPQSQIGRQVETNMVTGTYPLDRPGLARQGAEVYRANGCAYCHSQQVHQKATVCDVVLTNPGTNQQAVIEALTKVNADLVKKEGEQLFAKLPLTVLEGVEKEIAEAAAKTISAPGVKVEIHIVPVGPDIKRGWGKRQTVAADFLFDNPAMPGNLRVGPDLASVGLRLADVNWQLLHLYAPRSKVPGSPMPAYKFLFEKRKIGARPSADALQLPKEFSTDGFEIVPKPEAKALVAYLLSLRANVPLYEAPFTAPELANVATNAPAGATNTISGSTNAPPGATNSPAGNNSSK